MTTRALSLEQESLFRLIEDTREHVFVTGRAGTGKSTLLQHLAWNTSKQIAVCAPTGVAALNVEGQTIHSLFRLPIGLIADSEIDQSDATRKILNAIDTLVIDEISMVNADLMDGIDRSLRAITTDAAHILSRDRDLGSIEAGKHADFAILDDDPYEVDPVAIEQVLFNLVDNAAKYARHAEDLRVHLETERKGNRIFFVVRDHGPGIRSVEARRLFRRGDYERAEVLLKEAITIFPFVPSNHFIR